MKNFSVVILIGLLLMVFSGCSSSPEGTVAIKDLQRTMEQQIGQKVVVVGAVDTKNVGGMAITGLFRLYKGNDVVWASVPEGEAEPPQGVRVRVTGVVAEKDFPAGVGRRVYIESESIRME
jgi:ABC-type Fe3+-hydroxamate transport system substrate-binding protein